MQARVPAFVEHVGQRLVEELHLLGAIHAVQQRDLLVPRLEARGALARDARRRREMAIEAQRRIEPFVGHADEADHQPGEPRLERL